MHGSSAFWCEKLIFCAIWYQKCIILPRHARDKHRENSKREMHFSQALELLMCVVALAASLTNNFDDSDPLAEQAMFAQRGAIVVRKTPLFEPYMYKMHHFTKTGSGQT